MKSGISFSSQIVAVILSALVLGSTAQAVDPCAAYMGRGDDELGLVRCRDKYGGWNTGGNDPTVQPCPLQKKSPIQNLQDITRYAERAPRQNYSAPNADQNLLARIKQRTPAQEDCARKAPSKPQRIVIAFEGLSVIGKMNSQISTSNGQRPSELIPYGGMRSNLIGKGVNRVPNTRWQYHDESTARRAGQLSDSIRCAYEWATKPYKNSKGETVYSSVTIMGYSFGGNAAFQTAETLRRLGVTVDMMVTLDPRQPHTGMNAFNDRKPANVGRWVNYYERNLTMLPGFPVQGAENHRLSFFGGMSHVLASFTSETADGFSNAIAQVPVCRGNPSRVNSAPVSCN